ncbi:Spx/MgsR family RNA polymerase-binding regulatory protein [Varunaivibrio sulfuroxidans]|uniref:Spx/MgsR family transcriptional regulator n=1 Tax=Varunaivibrio sulfuroxidans TaxID=1773489 RepID=A0A4R3J7I9_9PROT|nr:Spx/MgsR family RNA polymerase-binding regulatory protein [Varunaivibrio sulfuroxidans]TCS61364.1 Spx/MgsR family transcriptional regulator [Varunaivibrio sulfuroxidans]WES31024.1 Spx/MgsR family RNA polymerase-binding regulatory protein [Varunaivibrio sulfuroxidans]
MIDIYGLKNCDTCRRAQKWAKGEGLDFRFHDLREHPIERASLEAWADAVGWSVLLNRRSTTWRNLDEDARTSLDETRALDLMVRHSALVKRPIFAFREKGVRRYGVGLDDALKGRLREAER